MTSGTLPLPGRPDLQFADFVGLVDQMAKLPEPYQCFSSRYLEYGLQYETWLAELVARHRGTDPRTDVVSQLTAGCIVAGLMKSYEGLVIGFGTKRVAALRSRFRSPRRWKPTSRRGCCHCNPSGASHPKATASICG